MSEPKQEGVDAGLMDMVRLVLRYAWTAVATAGVVAVVVAVLAGAYMTWNQEVTRVSYLQFRPTFSGADEGQYPNGLPFTTGDVTAGSIMNTVYDQGGVEEFCDADAFRSAFFVERYSDESLFLDLEYRDRLSQPRIELGERRELEEEYEAKRAALPMQYRLVMALPSDCSAMPQALVVKSMESVLATWASESESKRGVLNHQVEVLSPSTLDVVLGGPGGWVLGADLLRSALSRVILNIMQVEALPGAVLVRLGPERLTFMEIRTRLEDLRQFKLEPLVLTSGRSLAAQSLAWINETVVLADRDQALAESRVAVYRDALREYSGESRTGSRQAGGGATSGGQAMAQNIDRSFIDRIVEMSTSTSPFRQELTESMVKASLEAVDARNRANYYRRLVQSLREPSAIRMEPEELTARLNEIVAEGKVLTTQFGELYEEFSRVSLRPAGAIYQTLKPVASFEERAFSRRDLLRLSGGAFILTLLLTLGFHIVRERFLPQRPQTAG
jgi:hypothetical protein